MSFSTSQYPDRLWYSSCLLLDIYIKDAFLGVKTSLVRQVHYFPPSRADVKSEHSYKANASCAVFIFTEQILSFFVPS